MSLDSLQSLETIRTTAIDSRREAYHGFFEPDWGRALLVAAERTKVWDAAVDLCRTWQAASHARSWPWILTETADSRTREGLEELVPFSVQKIRIIREKLAAKLKDAGVAQRAIFWKKLDDAIRAIDAEATESMEVSRLHALDQLDEAWPGLVKLRQFHDMVWSSERTCYGAIYYNYECFLKECVRIAKGEDNYKVGREFSKDFRTIFGEDLTNQCWHDTQVNIARLARHALAHNGGKITPDLAKQPHPFLVVGCEIQIGASVTTDLYDMLTPKIMALVRAAKEMPEFSLSAAGSAESPTTCE